ncbi:MAG: hypothetical protein PVJ92_02605 [Candidatus Dependentiae bacterium]
MNRYPLTHFLTLLCCLVGTGLFAAPTITIDNQTERDLWGGIYYHNGVDAWRPADIFSLDAGSQQSAKLPSWQFRTSRMLLVAPHASQLTQKINIKEYQPAIAPLTLGLFSTRQLSVIATSDGPAIRPTKEAEAQKVLDDARDALLRKNPRDGVSAVVSTSSKLSKKEKSFLKKRRRTTLKTLSAFIEKSISPPHLPHISLCASGGGVRAAQATVGTLRGLHDIGLLGGLEYAVGVSGGTWGLFPWVASMQDISTYADRLSNRLTYGLMAKSLKQNYGEYNQQHKENLLIGRASNAIDLYGIMLSNMLIEPIAKNHRQFTLSSLSDHLHAAQHPFPLGTAVTRRLSKGEHHWLEYSPYDLRMITHAGDSFSIPVWAANRNWSEGHSEERGTELMLGYHLATWGSAFSVGMKDLVEKAPPLMRSLLPSFLQSALTETRWARSKWLSPFLPNFTKGMDNSPLAHKNHIHMSDAGHELNIPVHPLLHEKRPQDLLILIDSLRHERLNKETLEKLEKKLKAHSATSTFDATKACDQTLSYFPDTTAGKPSIIYIRLEKDDEYDSRFNPRTAGFCRTVNFAYKPAQSAQLMGLLSHIVVKHASVFKQAVKDAYQKRKKATSTWQWLVKRLQWGW